MKTAAVFIRQKNKRIDKPYDYLVPDNAEAGMRVVLRFGAGGKRKEGFIVQIKESSEFPDKLKQIEGQKTTLIGFIYKRNVPSLMSH